MTDNKTINKEENGIKHHLVRRRKILELFGENNSFLHKTENG